jgi:hypothetical protein
VQRAKDGVIPEAIFHPRNVLEWRCDASSGHDDPRLSGDLNRRIVLVCNEGLPIEPRGGNAARTRIHTRDRPRRRLPGLGGRGTAGCPRGRACPIPPSRLRDGGVASAHASRRCSRHAVRPQHRSTS